MQLALADLKQLSERLLARSKAEHCVVGITGNDSDNLRFARGSATTNGSRAGLRVTIASQFGKQSGAASVTGLDAEVLDEAVRRSEEIARQAPENPELLPPLGPQTYLPSGGYDAATASLRAEQLAAAAKPVIDEAVARKIDLTGYSSTYRNFYTMATSAGLFMHEPRTGADLTLTARNAEGSWSGWAGVSETRFDRVDALRLGRRAMDKAAHNKAPVALEPGKYTVILEPSAVCDFVGNMLYHMNARFADEGRSFFAQKGGGNKIGEKLFADSVTIFSDPADPMAPEPVYGEDGLPKRRTVWVENGVLRNLIYPRFWAQQKAHEPVSFPRSFVMAGGTTSIDDMIRDTKRGVLVTRLWYIRMLNPTKLVLTGLTRDGNFLIEDGRIAGPTINFRFNESPIAILANVVAVGPTERTRGGESADSIVAAPPLLVKDFTFSSESEAI